MRPQPETKSPTSGSYAYKSPVNFMTREQAAPIAVVASLIIEDPGEPMSFAERWEQAIAKPPSEAYRMMEANVRNVTPSTFSK